VVVARIAIVEEDEQRRAVHIGELDAPTLADELHAIGAQ